MITNYLFWVNVALGVWSVLCSHAANVFNGSSQRAKDSLMYLSMAGIAASIIRIVTLSIHFDWWWSISIIGAALIIGPAMFGLISNRLATLLGVAGFVAIPVLWYIGGIF